MNKEWVEQKNKEYCEDVQKRYAELRKAFEEAKFIPDDVKEKYLSKMDNKTLNSIDMEYLWLFCDDEHLMDCRKLTNSLEFEFLNDIAYGYDYAHKYNRYLDSEPMEFDGDIIITDPCYVMRAEHHGTTPLTDDDWSACDCGDNMEALGINHYMTRDTLYGDWSCTTFDLNTEKKIGSFCADAGLVSVFLLDEILKYNPDYDDHIKKDWTTTLIKDFKGTVQFVVKEERGFYEEDTKWWKKGEEWIKYYVEVVGHGINKVTGEAIDFVGTQTGL